MEVNQNCTTIAVVSVVDAGPWLGASSMHSHHAHNSGVGRKFFKGGGGAETYQICCALTVN